MHSKLVLFLVVFGASATLRAQTQPAPQSNSQQQPAPSSPPKAPQPSASDPTPDAPSQTEKEKEIEKQEQSQRILGVLPQFGTTSRHNAPPLTSGEKFHLFYKSAFDPVEIGVVGLQSGLSQAEDEFPEYGQGAAGYGKRFGATLADEVSSGFFANYFYPVLLHEDPRYFRLGEGSIPHRIGYALAQEFVARTDSGKRTFSWENVLGAFSSGTLSNAYYPPAERGLALTMSRSTIAIGYGSLGALVDEFYPDISRKILHHQPKKVAEQKQP